MKKTIITGIACLAGCIGIAGCGLGNTENEIITTEPSETITTESSEIITTKSSETIATVNPAEAWKADYSDVTVMPKQDPDTVWADTAHAEVRLRNGIHIYLPTLFDNADEIEFGNIGYGIRAFDTNTNTYSGEYLYYPYEKTDGNPSMIECPADAVQVCIQEIVLEISGECGDTLPLDDEVHKYKEFARKDGKVYYFDLTPGCYGGTDYANWFSDKEHYGIYNLDYMDKYGDKIINSAWVE